MKLPLFVLFLFTFVHFTWATLSFSIPIRRRWQKPKNPFQNMGQNILRFKKEQKLSSTEDEKMTYNPFTRFFDGFTMKFTRGELLSAIHGLHFDQYESIARMMNNKGMGKPKNKQDMFKKIDERMTSRVGRQFHDTVQPVNQQVIPVTNAHGVQVAPTRISTATATDFRNCLQQDNNCRLIVGAVFTAAIVGAIGLPFLTVGRKKRSLHFNDGDSVLKLIHDFHDNPNVVKN